MVEPILEKNTVSVTIAKALKLKNRLVQRLQEVRSGVTFHNSVLEEQVKEFDVAAALEKEERLMNALMGLKTQIALANAGIQETLILQGELKSKINFLKTLPTQNGVVRHDYQNTTLVYHAFLKAEEITNRVVALETYLDTLQDKVDEYNHSTTFEVSRETIKLCS